MVRDILTKPFSNAFLHKPKHISKMDQPWDKDQVKVNKAFPLKP